MEQNPGWYPHPQFKDLAETFEEKYQMIDLQFTGDRTFAKKKTNMKEGRHCIFCNKDYPAVPFNGAPHLLSRMIGNTDLFSTFECDVCNNKFSLFESDLASFLGLGRSLSGMKDEKKAPGFQGIGLKAISIVFKGRKIMAIKKEDAERNIDEGTTKLKYGKASHTPVNVYKLFLKCALSILPNKEVVSDYQFALRYLQGQGILEGTYVDMYRFPITVKMPLHVYVFKRKTEMDVLPKYIVSFYFDNLVISIPVLLHKDEYRIMEQQIQPAPPAPYFLHGADVHALNAHFSRYMLSSDKSKNEPEEYILKVEKSYFQNAARLDLQTGEIIEGPYEPNGSKYIIATEEGSEFTNEELMDLVKAIDREFSPHS